MHDDRVSAPLVLDRELIGLSQAEADLLRDHAGLPDRCNLVGIKVAEHHNKLVAAKAGNGVGVAQTAADASCRCDQEHIPCRMPMRIIERLEIIQINEYQRR